MKLGDNWSGDTDGGDMEEVETHRLIWTPPSLHLREPANYTPDYSQGFTAPIYLSWDGNTWTISDSGGEKE